MRRGAIGILRAISPFLLGSLGIFAWNIVVGGLAHRLGVGPEAGPDAPIATRTQAELIFVLVQTTLAGVVGATLATRIAHSRPGIHLVAFTAIWFVLDVLGMTLGPGSVSPVWFKMTALTLVPPQLYAGFRLGLLWRGSSRGVVAE